MGRFSSDHFDFIDRTFENYDSDPWGRVIHPLWKAIIWHVDDAWLSLHSTWCEVSSSWIVPLVHKAPQRVDYPMII